MKISQLRCFVSNTKRRRARNIKNFFGRCRQSEQCDVDDSIGKAVLDNDGQTLLDDQGDSNDD